MTITETTTDMTPPPVRVVADDLRGLDPDSAAGEILRRATAPRRHFERVRAALWTSLAAGYDPDDDPDGVTLAALAGLACASDHEALPPGLLDVHAADVEHGDGIMTTAAAGVLLAGLHGHGGRYGAGGESGATDRPAALGGLGKGRRQATDGGAWDSAIDSALAVIESAVASARIAPYRGPLLGGDPADFVPYDVYDDVWIRLGFGPPVKLRAVVGTEFAAAIARAALLHTAGLDEYAAPHVALRIDSASTTQQWAAVVDALDEADSIT